MSRIRREIALFPAVTIASGAATSSTIPSDGYSMFGIALPAAFTGTSLTFNVSPDGVTFQPLYDATGAQVKIATVAQGQSYDAPSEIGSWPFFQIVSSTSEGGARTIVVVAKG